VNGVASGLPEHNALSGLSRTERSGRPAPGLRLSARRMKPAVSFIMQSTSGSPSSRNAVPKREGRGRGGRWLSICGQVDVHNLSLGRSLAAGAVPCGKPPPAAEPQ